MRTAADVMRDPRKDPKPGDVVRVDRTEITVDAVEIMPMNRIDVNGIRRGSKYVQYLLRSAHPGIVFYQSFNGFVRRIKKAEVLHVAS